MIKSLSKLRKQNKEKFRVPRSAQDVIDIDVIYKDGIFQKGKNYSKVFRFEDINYSIASKNDKMGLFLDYSELLNSFCNLISTLSLKSDKSILRLLIVILTNALLSNEFSNSL